MDLGLRRVTLTVSLLTLFSAGCISRTTVVPTDQRLLPAQTRTKAALLEDLEKKSRAISTLNARMFLDASTGTNKSGIIKKYAETAGLILVERPGLIRIQSTYVGITVFDMVSNGSVYKASIPTENKFLEAEANAPATCENAFLNLRPQIILDALFVNAVPYMTNPRIVPLLEETTIGRSSYYVMTFAEVDLEKKDGRIVEKTWIDRLSLDVSRRQLYNADGQLETDAQYSEYQTFGDTRFPLLISVLRPTEETTLKITFTGETVKLNGQLTAESFQLERPEGSQPIEMENCGKKPPR